jgi:hypothetical protein
MMTQSRNVNTSLGGCLCDLGSLWDLDRRGPSIIVVYEHNMDCVTIVDVWHIDLWICLCFLYYILLFFCFTRFSFYVVLWIDSIDSFRENV